MLASVAVPPAGRRASAFRRFPPGCGRRTNAAARLPPRYPLPPTAAASKPPLPNPSPARAASRTALPQPRRTLPAAAASSGAAGPGRGVGRGRKAAAAVTARRVSAVRRYPPGCGRGVAAPKPPASVGEGQGGAGAGKTASVVCNRYATARPCDRDEFNSSAGMQNEGGDDAGAQEEVGGKPWVVTGLMAVPFLPWARYGRRSQRLNV